jgi:mono/diheme cytochrome c family protein
MADKETEKSKPDEVLDISSHEPDAPQASSGGEVAHDDHSGFHTYSGGVIIERGDRPIDARIWATYAFVIVFIIAGVFLGGYLSKPADTSDTSVINLSNQMAQQASYVSLTSPDLIDMNQLQKPVGQTLPQAITAGTAVYQSYCIGCHGPNQDGAGPNAVSLNPSPRNLRDQPFMQAMSYQRIWTSIHKGVPGTAMPRWENTLSDDQIRDVICYVFSLTAPTDPKTGQFISPAASDLSGQSSPTTASSM